MAEHNKSTGHKVYFTTENSGRLLIDDVDVGKFVSAVEFSYDLNERTPTPKCSLSIHGSQLEMYADEADVLCKVLGIEVPRKQSKIKRFLRRIFRRIKTCWNH